MIVVYSGIKNLDHSGAMTIVERDGGAHRRIMQGEESYFTFSILT